MSIIERSTLINLLRDTLAEVTFNKINGDERVMHCTLMQKFLPVMETKEDATPKKVNEDVLNVWDVDAKGFRSFRMANITKVTV